MVISDNKSSIDRKAKTSAVEIRSPLKRSVTISPTRKSLEDEVIYLRSQNKALKSAIKAVKKTASENLSKSYELVWYAKNRTRYPAHKVSNWLDKSDEHSDDIKALKGSNGDYHHGFNSGLLAASRMFKEHVDIGENGPDSEDPWTLASKINQKVEASKNSFPDLRASEFPPIRGE
ncbi:hypothetical protein ACHAXS_003292 [Conticribra weissflogii]